MKDIENKLKNWLELNRVLNVLNEEEVMNFYQYEVCNKNRQQIKERLASRLRTIKRDEVNFLVRKVLTELENEVRS